MNLALRPTSLVYLIAFTFALAQGCSCRQEGTFHLPDLDGGETGAHDAATATDVTSDARHFCALSCATANASICCESGQTCAEGRCLPACNGTRCGTARTCCPASQLCVGEMCVSPGPECSRDGECTGGQTCDPVVNRCLPVPPGAACRFLPPPGQFEPTLQWAWTDADVLSAPLVVELTDDNRDGHIDEHDVPDVVVLAFPDANTEMTEGWLQALSGDDGHALWATPHTLCGGSAPAAADLDGDGNIEIVAFECTERAVLFPTPSPARGRAVAFNHDGTERWRSALTDELSLGDMVLIGNIDNVGNAEVVVGHVVFDANGVERWHAAPEFVGRSAALADVDGDSRLELIGSNAAYDDNGTLLWSLSGVTRASTAIARITVASQTGAPDALVIGGNAFAIVNAATGEIRVAPVQYESGTMLGAGTPTVADFDGDAEREFAVAGQQRFVVFKLSLPAPHILWSAASNDVSTGSVGSTVFDFDGDNRAEVIWGDECHLRIARGSDGTLLWSTRNSSITRDEYPVVADVDGDDNAEVIIVGNTSFQVPCGMKAHRVSGMPDVPLPSDGAQAGRGVRVYQDRLDNWVSTRRVWNQHAYHIDNVEDDGRIPMSETPSWTSHNSFRLNRLRDGDAVTLAADLVISSIWADTALCPASARVFAQLENRGSRAVPAGVRVAFYSGVDATSIQTLLGVATTTAPIFAGASAEVSLIATGPAAGNWMFHLQAIADNDGLGSGRIHGQHSECHEDNNVSGSALVDCRGLL